MDTLIILIGKTEDPDNENSMHLLAVEKTPNAYIRINTDTTDSLESLMATIRTYAVKTKFCVGGIKKPKHLLVTVGYKAKVTLSFIPLLAIEVLMLEINSS